MGPRSDERGNQHRSAGSLHLRMLQWGRVRMNAEMFVAAYFLLSGPYLLQWGRVRMNAEIPAVGSVF